MTVSTDTTTRFSPLFFCYLIWIFFILFYWRGNAKWKIVAELERPAHARALARKFPPNPTGIPTIYQKNLPAIPTWNNIRFLKHFHCQSGILQMNKGSIPVVLRPPACALRSQCTTLLGSWAHGRLYTAITLTTTNEPLHNGHRRDKLLCQL